MQKTDIPGIYKERDGILINRDEEGLIAYKKRKQQFNKIVFLENEMNILKNDIAEMKEMIRSLTK
jgi:hypothetical protein